MVLRLSHASGTGLEVDVAPSERMERVFEGCRIMVRLSSILGIKSILIDVSERLR